MSESDNAHDGWSFPVETGHVMQFARAIGDPNPIYADAGYARATDLGQVIAPPTFTMASAHFDPDWPLRPRPGEPWRGSGRTPSGTADPAEPGDGVADEDSGRPSGGEVRLHAEQHFEYHRHVRPGDVLTATERPGRTWEKDGRRGGHMYFSETVIDYHDQDCDLVITARRVGVRITQLETDR